LQGGFDTGTRFRQASLTEIDPRKDGLSRGGGRVQFEGLPGGFGGAGQVVSRSSAREVEFHAEVVGVLLDAGAQNLDRFAKASLGEKGAADAGGGAGVARRTTQYCLKFRTAAPNALHARCARPRS